jgi:hypothetical protein
MVLFSFRLPDCKRLRLSIESPNLRANMLKHGYLKLLLLDVARRLSFAIIYFKYLLPSAVPFAQKGTRIYKLFGVLSLATLLKLVIQEYPQYLAAKWVPIRMQFLC